MTCIFCRSVVAARKYRWWAGEGRFEADTPGPAVPKGTAHHEHRELLWSALEALHAIFEARHARQKHGRHNKRKLLCHVRL